MKIAISTDGKDLESSTSTRFGRCSFFIFVDTDTMDFSALANPAKQASGGAGIQAAQFVMDNGAQVILTEKVGPNALRVLEQANIHIFICHNGKVNQAVKMFIDEELESYDTKNRRK
ncbi:MAG TPA: dinitrogenase iron-molybdenum cofactor biosynthesis protein [Anaerolineae bacterium]|nr:dinitrogenase iron-molybdenum cofactor biosynthesis protein [Anaerolineae bacterium]